MRIPKHGEVWWNPNWRVYMLVVVVEGRLWWVTLNGIAQLEILCDKGEYLGPNTLAYPTVQALLGSTGAAGEGANK